MGHKVTLGGDRLGSGNKNKVSLHGYERSTHNLDRLFKSTMAAGTLVPCMLDVALPGDTWDIDLDIDIMTPPTVGPLFGSFKVQVDLFYTPMELYIGELLYNKTEVGMNPENIKLPQIVLEAPNLDLTKPNIDNQQINPSSIFKYLGISGLGYDKDESDEVTRVFNGIPFLAYWDIYKNYYANKQEEIGAVLHTPVTDTLYPAPTQVKWRYQDPLTGTFTSWATLNATHASSVATFAYMNNPQIELGRVSSTPILDASTIMLKTDRGSIPLSQIFNTNRFNSATTQIVSDYRLDAGELKIFGWEMVNATTTIEAEPNVKTFPLKNIDKMRDHIMVHSLNAGVPFDVTNTAIDKTLEPYNLPFSIGQSTLYASKMYSQEGLALKTYQSDLFNNWLRTEWIEGNNSIAQITKVSTATGGFTIDSFNLASKVYDMLNRIAVSGGSWDDYLDATYTHDRVRRLANPVYQGGLIRELIFQEIVSNAASGDQPLGTLAGRGRLHTSQKGGKVRIKCDHPSYIMGIVSITPRIDYSQGNKWDTNLQTIADLHRPALDGIGFQDLITDQMAFWSTGMDVVTAGIAADPEFKSAGKQPAWINYMTAINEVYGHFADESQGWMVLNRRYEPKEENGVITIKDLTTYIDPAKYNYIFAYQKRDAQNFWVQISMKRDVRRKMSAKQIPNL